MDPWEQSATVDPEVRAYVYSLVNAVGGRASLDGAYSVGDDALATLKDIRRWLLLYDERSNRLDVKRVLAEANLVRGDLLEILSLWPEDAPESGLRSKLAFACLELLVPLTWPLRLQEDTATLNTHRHLPYISLAQVSYKRAILHHEGTSILKQIIRIALPAMAMSKQDRSRRDEGVIMLMMLLFKHVAEIVQPQDLPSQGDENDISRAAVIDAYASQDVLNLLLTIGSAAADEFVEHDVELLEIMYHLLKGIDPQKLFMKKVQVMKTEMKEFKDLLNKERQMLKRHNKTAPTRHNRFGTMIWLKGQDQKLVIVSGQNSITNTGSLLEQVDTSKKWNKPKYKGRRFAADEDNDFLPRIELPDSTRDTLRQFVEDFLDSSFNPLFSSLRKGIERELDRVKDSNINQYFYLMSWFLQAETARHDFRTGPQDENENSFAYLAAVLDQETFVLLNRTMQRAIDEKDWPMLQSSMLAFTQILETVKRMSDSNNEEDQEIAENILNRIFYEETTHDRIASVLRSYSQQGLSYLDTVTECAHVFLRLLEQYSKQNADMQIRSKRRARKKAMKDNTADQINPDGDAEQAAEDNVEAERTVRERKFDFKRFVGKFLNQGAVNTFLTFLTFHEEMNDEQIKRCHRYFYRLAFKNDLSLLLFRIDVLHLFNRMIRGPDQLNRASAIYGDWETLIMQVFRKCIKWITKETEGQGWTEMCVVEMLFSKIPSTHYYLQNAAELYVEKKAPRPPAELVFKAGVTDEQKIGIAVSAVIDRSNSDVLKWLKEKLESAIDERQSWEDADAARDSLRSDEDVVESHEAPMIMLLPGTEEMRMALFKDKHFRLLLTSLKLYRSGLAEDVDAVWHIPGHINAAQLQENLDAIQKAEFDPPTFDDGQSALDMIRNKSSVRATADDVDAIAMFSDDDQNDEQRFPPNLREKRKRHADNAAPKKRRRLQKRAADDETLSDIEARAEARKKKERERNAKIKSKLFVTASDDESDEEADEQFFRKEEERRNAMRGVIKKALQTQKRRETGKIGDNVTDSEDDAENGLGIPSDASDSDNDAPGSVVEEITPRIRRPLFDDLSSDEDDGHDAASGSSDIDRQKTNDASSSTSVEVPRISPLKEVSANIMHHTGAVEDEDLVPAKSSRAPATRRSAFILDDSESE